MSAINNLSQPQLSEIFRRLKALENAAPMNNGAVGRSGFEVYDNGTINVSSGNIIGAGTFSWQGSFSQSGTTTLTGATTLAGPTGVTGTFTVQGVTRLNGPTTVGADFEISSGGLFKAGQSTIKPDGSAKFGLFDIAANGNLTSKGTLSIEGVTTLKSDLNVTTGGKVKVGQMTIDPTANGGSIMFPNNQNIYASATRLVGASLLLTGTLEVTNSVTFKGLQATTSAANVYYNPATGVLYYKT